MTPFEKEVMKRYGFTENEYAEFDEKILDKLIQRAYNEDKGYKIIHYVDTKTYNSFIDDFIDDIHPNIEDESFSDSEIERYWQLINEYVYGGSGLGIIYDANEDWLLVCNADANFSRDVVSKEDNTQINELTHDYIRLDYAKFKQECEQALKREGFYTQEKEEDYDM